MIIPIIISLLAATVIPGDSSTTTWVTTSVSGENTTAETNITSEVNGERVTVSHDAPGTVEVKQQNGTSSVVIDGIPVTPTKIAADASETATTAVNDRIFRIYPYVEKWQKIIEDITRSIRSFLFHILDNGK